MKVFFISLCSNYCMQLIMGSLQIIGQCCFPVVPMICYSLQNTADCMYTIQSTWVNIQGSQSASKIYWFTHIKECIAQINGKILIKWYIITNIEDEEIFGCWLSCTRLDDGTDVLNNVEVEWHFTLVQVTRVRMPLDAFAYLHIPDCPWLTRRCSIALQSTTRHTLAQWARNFLLSLVCCVLF